MAYKIEDIDWDKMPASAVEFALEDEEYFFTWYNDSNYYMSNALKKWQNSYFDDNRERYKVSDYHPDSISTMSDADKIKYFLKELSELSNKYKVVIHGCGCMGSPSLHTEDFVEGGCYTVDEYNDFLEYSHKG